MTKNRTEIVQRSKDKGILETVGREFFQMYCDEHRVLESCMENLVNMANDDSDKSIQSNVNKFLVEQLIGKPKQGVDLGLEQGIEIKITRNSPDAAKEDKS